MSCLVCLVYLFINLFSLLLNVFICLFYIRNELWFLEDWIRDEINFNFNFCDFCFIYLILKTKWRQFNHKNITRDEKSDFIFFVFFHISYDVLPLSQRSLFFFDTRTLFFFRCMFFFGNLQVYWPTDKKKVRDVCEDFLKVTQIRWFFILFFCCCLLMKHSSTHFFFFGNS